MNIFLFGAGYSCLAFADRIAGAGHKISGTSRDVDKLAALENASITPFLFDGISPNQQIDEKLNEVTHLVISIAPPRQSSEQMVDPVLDNFTDTILDRMPKLVWIGYLSTVGVYGDHGGEWVNETAMTTPLSERSIQRDRAEKLWIELAENKEVALSILRLSGIYGPGRNPFVTIEAGRARRLVKKHQVFNRVHVADIAQALDLAANRQMDGIFNITDNQPAPPQDVVSFACQLMGREEPEALDFETADITSMARSFYGENKRVANQKSVHMLGIKYQYPDYITGLSKMWQEKTW